MTDKEYLQEMLNLTVKLTKTCETDGMGSDAYNAVLKEIASRAVKFNRSRRRYVWFTKVSIVLLLCILAWGLYTIWHWLRL